MRKKLFDVEELFQIQGRGLVLTGNIEENSPSFKAGDTVILVKPNGEEIEAQINGIEIVKRNFRVIGMSILNLTKNEVPNETEVFLVV